VRCVRSLPPRHDDDSRRGAHSRIAAPLPRDPVVRPSSSCLQASHGPPAGPWLAPRLTQTSRCCAVFRFDLFDAYQGTPRTRGMEILAIAHGLRMRPREPVGWFCGTACPARRGTTSSRWGLSIPSRRLKTRRLRSATAFVCEAADGTVTIRVKERVRGSTPGAPRERLPPRAGAPPCPGLKADPNRSPRPHVAKRDTAQGGAGVSQFGRAVQALTPRPGVTATARIWIGR
jgi:hypothetical protein